MTGSGNVRNSTYVEIHTRSKIHSAVKKKSDQMKSQTFTAFIVFLKHYPIAGGNCVSASSIVSNFTCMFKMVTFPTR